MPIRIQAPDGSIAEFPDGTPDDTITGVMAKTFGGPKAKAKPNSFVDSAKAFVSGAAEGWAPIADTLLSAGPLGAIKRAADATNLFQGHPTPSLSGGVSQFASTAQRDGYTPQTTMGQYARTVGQMTPAVVAPGSIGARAANVFAPAIASETAGQAAHAMGASPGVEQVARGVGALAGGVAASARINRLTPAPAGSDEQVANVFARKANADPEAMAAKAADLRASGVEPTLLDVGGAPAQRLTRAVGVTNDAAGETLANNAQEVGSTTKPAVMAQTRGLTGETRTATQVAADLDKARRAEANTVYAEPYAQKVDLTDLNAIQALRDPEGASAINRAIAGARSRMDYGAVADLQALKATANGPTGSGQVWPTTGRALDRVQIAFRDRGNQLAQNGANDIASGMFKRQELINGVLDNVEGLTPARAAYRAKSQAIDILTKPGARLDPFSTDPADYKSWVDSLPPEAQHANQVGIRQDILDQLGSQRGGTVGSIDELATSQYAKQNLAHALGDTEAGKYLSNLSARLAQRGNAQFVSPNGGSRTAVLQNDVSGAEKALSLMDTGHKIATGNVPGLAMKTVSWLKTRGLSDQQAQTLAKAAVDPRRVDGVIEAIRRLKGPDAAKGFIEFRGGLIGAARGAATSSTQPQPLQ